MEPFSALVGGGLAGFFGAGAAHALTTLAARGGSDGWLRGGYGPPFFNIALYTGVFYAAIGAAAGRNAKTSAVGFAGAFFGIVLPLFVLSRYSGWEPIGTVAEGRVPVWETVVLVIYVLAIWGTIAGIGAAAVRAAPWRGALAAVGGSLAGYAVLAVLLKLFASWAKSPWNAASLIPSPVNLLDGLLSGAGLCLGLSVERRLSRRTT